MEKERCDEEQQLEISYNHEGGRHYMVIKSREEKVLPFQINMIRHNEIDSLLDIRFYIDNGEYQYFYDISDKISLSRHMSEKKYGIAQIRTIMSCLFRLVTELEEYMLNPECLILNPDYIFTDREFGTVYFCYYMGHCGSFNKSMEELFDCFMNQLDYKDSKGVAVVFQAYQNMRRENTSFLEVMRSFCIEDETTKEYEEADFPAYREMDSEEDEPPFRAEQRELFRMPKVTIQLPDFEKMLKKLALLVAGCAGYVLYENRIGMSKGSLIGTLVLIAALVLFSFMDRESKGQEEERMEKVEETESIPEDRNCRDWIKKGENDNLGLSKKERDTFKITSREEELFEELSFERREPEKRTDLQEKIKPDRIPATIILDSTVKRVSVCPVLKYEGEKNLEDIVLDRADLIVGKVRGIAGILLDDQGISRIHARICENDGRFYVMDLGSTNGTYLNGSRLPENKRVVMKDGDCLRFADNTFKLLIP